MYILFKNIPIGIHDQELANFIKSNFKKTIESADLPISVAGIEILEKQDNFCHPIEQYALVRISPDKAANITIKEFNGCFFNQLQITVREYSTRSASNDPRLKNPHLAEQPFKEKRIKDRRNHVLIPSRLV
ncbi:MAG: hypothetical protein KAQ91_08505 [Methylococcales bacterium]|nr:hypothetical protein [Methylococcales bacterium]